MARVSSVVTCPKILMLNLKGVVKVSFTDANPVIFISLR